ncbi:hypothetical protein O3T00_30540 [Escherichia coli]|uniref:hypothetical protein n=1 Tax=Escherichia coli TaxID=562 RepID=UPI0027395052|nr:hypothetical protein [Escherichia coli]MDP4455592.1 hypothetical protein [Escherichia coli]
MKKEDRSLIRWVSLSCDIFAITLVIGVAYYAAMGVLGLVYNPVPYYFSEWINWMQPKIKLPVTYHDPSLYLDNGTYSIGDYILSIGYLFGFFFAQLYVAIIFLGKLNHALIRKIIIYKATEDFRQKYFGVKEARFKRLLNEQDLEDISRKHWEKWREYYKSNMSYDEWKQKFKKVL